MVQNATAMGANAITMMRFELLGDRQHHERDRGLRHGGVHRAGGPASALGVSIQSQSQVTLTKSNFPVGLVILIAPVVVLIVLAAVFGWERYQGGGPGGPGAISGARPTAEVFIDPETGRPVRVWFDERTGQREYHPE